MLKNGPLVLWVSRPVTVGVIVAILIGLVDAQESTTHLPSASMGACSPDNPCLNGGTCVPVVISLPSNPMYTCECAQYTSGRDCEFQDSNTQVQFLHTGYLVVEGDGEVEIEFRRTGELAHNTTIEVSTYSLLTANMSRAESPDDYQEIPPRRMEFRRDQAVVRTRIVIRDDQTVEETEVFYMFLDVVRGGVLAGTDSIEITIYDDDVTMSSSVIDFTFVTLERDIYEVDENIGSVPIDIIRSGYLDVTTRIYLFTVNGTATDPSDYTAIVNEAIVFAPGEDIKSWELDIIDDDVVEMTVETMSVVIEVQSGGEIGEFGFGELTIIDNDSGPTPAGPTDTNIWVLAALIGGGVLALIIIVVVFLVWCLKCRKSPLESRSKADPMQMEEQRYVSQPASPNEAAYKKPKTSARPPQGGRGPKKTGPASSRVSGPTRGKDGSFPRDLLRLKEEVGRGSFAAVIKAEAHGIIRPGRTTVVAVKMLKETATDNDRSDFLKELTVFKMLEPHPHVVTMLGYCTAEEPMYIILEYLPNGNLQSYLQGVRKEEVVARSSSDGSSLEPKEILSYGLQIAKGMKYLASKKCIHRDLATRNILLGAGNMCKVADFGLARDIMDQRQYEMQSKGRVPVRWLALESLLRNIYTSKSDVWSFGILLWELVTLGSHPYPGLSSTKVISELKKGYRLPRPEHCSLEIYDFMMRCWLKDADKRPTFEEVVRCLDDMLMNAEGYLIMTDFRDDQYEYLIPNMNTDGDSE